MTQSTKPIQSLLFVCWGNICRSPSAENVMRKLLEDEGIEGVTCDSAGTMRAHEGHPPDSRMSAAGRRRGLPMTGSARCIEPSDFDRFDLILAMDRSNYSDIMAVARSQSDRDKIQLFCEYCSESDHSEVPDPYYGGPDGFELVLDLLEDGCQGILERIRQSHT